MSVLLAYADSKHAAIFSDSRITYFDKDKRIIHTTDDRQKIFKITDNFIIACAGDARCYKLFEDINSYNNHSHFFSFTQKSYEFLLEFIFTRINTFEFYKLPYMSYITIGIDSMGRIRMDSFNNKESLINTAIPKDDDFYTSTHFSENVPEFLKSYIIGLLPTEKDKELFCEKMINKISTLDETVGGSIQKIQIHII